MTATVVREDDTRVMPAYLTVRLETLDPPDIAEVIAGLIAACSVTLRPLSDDEARLPGVETWLSPDRTVLVMRQYQIRTDTFTYAVRVVAPSHD